MTYNIQHKNDGKNYVYRNSSGDIKILYNPEIATNGLVVHLDSTQYVTSASVNNTWSDLSGNNNNAKLYNGVTHDGKFFVFDGIDEYAEVTNNSAINSCLSSNFTYEIWVYLQTGGHLWGKVFSKGQYVFNTGAFNGLTHYQPGSLFWQYMPSGGSSAELFYSSPIKNAWTQLVYTRTSGSMKFYRNGVLQSSTTNNINFSNNYNLRISANSSPVLEPCKQKVMIFRQYNRGLSDTEVLQNYNASISKTTQTNFASLVEDYGDRSFVTFNSSEINKIDFNYVAQTDETTLRKSVDGSLTFVKWTGSPPNFIQDLTTKQSVVSYTQISSDTNNSSWIVSDAPNPYPDNLSFLNSTDQILEW